MISKVVYVLAGDGCDVYSMMTRISIATLRINNPKVEVVLAIDAKTYDSASKKGDLLLKEVDSIKVVESPDFGNAFRSRFVKTQLGTLIEGAFLFLDADTVIRAPINLGDMSDAVIGAAINNCRKNQLEQLSPTDSRVLKAMGWQLEAMPYLNSGVLYYSGDDSSRQFSNQWHTLWFKGFERTGEIIDQPSLYKVIVTGKYKVNILDHKYNAQVKNRVWWKSEDNGNNSYVLDWDNVIVHYYGSLNDAHLYTNYEILLKDSMRRGEFSTAGIKALVKSPHPWRSASSLDEAIIRSTRQKPRITGAYKLWIEGRRLQAVLYWLRSKMNLN